MIQDAAGLEAAALEKIHDPTFFPCWCRVVAEPGKPPGKQVCQQRLFIIPFTGGRQCLLGTAARAGSDIALSAGQTVYVPIYSHIYSGNKARPFDLAAILSIRNTDMDNTVNLLRSQQSLRLQAGQDHVGDQGQDLARIELDRHAVALEAGAEVAAEFRATTVLPSRAAFERGKAEGHATHLGHPARRQVVGRKGKDADATAIVGLQVVLV